MTTMLIFIFLMLWIILTICGMKVVVELEWKFTINGSFLLSTMLLLLDAVISFFIAAWITGIIGKMAGVI